MDYIKKFNVGLTLQTDLAQFNAFLDKYHEYIHSVYFSPPAGIRFHTRSKIAEQFMLPSKKKLFWKLLQTIKEHGIELELLLNTLRLDEKSVEKAGLMLKKHDVTVDSVCFIKDYYDYVVRYFPDAKYIFSFNNGFSKKEIEQATEQYKDVNVFVLGTHFIRDNEYIGRLKEKGKRVYLLLNNGCSFNCPTCNNTGSVCKETFLNNLKRHSPEYLYALQSIFPCELEEKVIDGSLPACLKISNRGNDIVFLQNCMDSFINCEMLKYIEKSSIAYAYWGRAGYFWKYYKAFDFNEIKRLKEEILHRKFNIK